MNSRLQNLYNKIETQRKKLLLSLTDLSNEKFNEHGKWSINQIIAHLITSENLSVRYLNKKILGINEVKDSGIVEELKMILLIVSVRLPLKFKAPKVVVDHTSKETDRDKLIHEWDKTREELKNLIRSHRRSHQTENLQTCRGRHVEHSAHFDFHERTCGSSYTSNKKAAEENI